MNKKINEIIDKIMESYEDELERNPNVQRMAARRGEQPSREPEKPIRYEDWLKKQPKPKTIGLHKQKKTK